MLGGKPASAYVLAQPVQDSGATTSSSGSHISGGAAGAPGTARPGRLAGGLSPLVTVTGTTNYIPVFTANDGSLGNSTMFQNGSNLGIGTTTAQRKFSIVSKVQNNSQLSLGYDEAGNMMTFDSAQGAGLGNIVAGAYWNGASYLYGGTRGAARVRMHDAELRFMIGAAAGSAGAPVIWNERLIIANTGNVGIGTTTPAAPLDVAGDMHSSGNFTATGGVTAASFSGSGAGLTNLNAAGISAGTANIDITGNASTATNAQALGGLAATNYALLGAANSFGASQSITGNLTLSGKINGMLTLTPNTSDIFSGSNYVSANVLDGYSTNSITSGVTGATISGGGGVRANFGTILANVVTDDWGTVSGGFSNRAGNNAGTFSDALAATVAGGAGNVASGSYATVVGGNGNTAAGTLSFAAGCFANAAHPGAFVWADSNCTAPGLSSTASNQFIVRAAGGAWFYTNGTATSGVTLPAGGGAWSTLSDRNAKERFHDVDGTVLLARLNAVPILTWNYRSQDASIRHMGPVAQDFRAAFGLGEDDKHISTVDADGVALAGVQALYRLTRQQDAEVKKLRESTTRKDAQIQALAAENRRLALEVNELRRAQQELRGMLAQLARGTVK